MKLETDWYTKFILTAIAIGLLLNAAGAFFYRMGAPSLVFAGSETSEVRVAGSPSGWPLKVEIVKMPK